MYVLLKEDLSIVEVKPEDAEAIAAEIVDAKFFTRKADAEAYARTKTEEALSALARKASARAKTARLRAEIRERFPEMARQAHLSTLQARGLDTGIIDLSKPVY
jgi:hypothetical protein